MEAYGPQLCVGYLDPALNAAFTPDGFFRTGDLAVMDADGFLRITGRRKDVIIRKGENLSAKGIEDELAAHPKVADVAVIGVPDAASRRARLRLRRAARRTPATLSLDERARLHGGARRDAPEDPRAARRDAGAAAQRDRQGPEGRAAPARPRLSARAHDSQVVGTRGSGAYEHSVPVRIVRARCSPSAGCVVADPVEDAVNRARDADAVALRFLEGERRRRPGRPVPLRGGDQDGHVQLLARALQQLREQAHALGVADTERAPGELDGPVVALVAEHLPRTRR